MWVKFGETAHNVPLMGRGEVGGGKGGHWMREKGGLPHIKCLIVDIC